MLVISRVCLSGECIVHISVLILSRRGRTDPVLVQECYRSLSEGFACFNSMKDLRFLLCFSGEGVSWFSYKHSSTPFYEEYKFLKCLNFYISAVTFINSIIRIKYLYAEM